MNTEVLLMAGGHMIITGLLVNVELGGTICECASAQV